MTSKPTNETSLESSDSQIQAQVEDCSKERTPTPARKKPIRIALIVIAILAALGILLTLSTFGMVKMGEMSVNSTYDYEDSATITYEGSTYTLNENMVSICIMGLDRESHEEEGSTVGQADVIMVLALDTSTGETTVINIARDSMVDMEIYRSGIYAGIEEMQICLAFAYGDGEETSCEYTTTAASRVLYSTPIYYYFAMELSSISALCDEIDGVTLTPLESIPDTDIVEGQEIELLGDDAVNYIQWRDTTSLNSSTDRQARQVQFLNAFASQSFDLAQDDLTVLIGLYNTACEYSTTNLGMCEFSYLATAMLSGGTVDFKMISLPGETSLGDLWISYYLDEEAVMETVLDVYYTQVD